MFADFSKINSWVLLKDHIKGTDIYECVQFGEYPNKNPDLVHLNVVS